MRTANDGKTAAIRGLGANAAGYKGPPALTHYGYVGDPTSDSNTRLGLERNNNILNADSVALTPDLARGRALGDSVSAGGHFLGFYHDVTDRAYSNRVDIYDPGNQFH